MDSRLLVKEDDVDSMDFAKRRDLLVDISRRCLTRLSHRANFRLNPVIYERGALGEHFEGLSLFEYALIEKERYYKRIGRYRDDTQYPLTDGKEVGSPFFGVDQKREIFKPRIEISDFLDFYLDLLHQACEPGENPGRTIFIADLDVDCVDDINSRIHFGRYIIDQKAKNPEMAELLKDYTPNRREEVLQQIVIREQERRVIDSAKQYASDNGMLLSPETIEFFISGLIRRNTQVQLQHLKLVYRVDLGDL